jgi:DNA invertase Pin-like site-specific DNA recombinase
MGKKKVFYGRCSKEESKQKNSIDTQKMIVEQKYGTCDEYYTDIGISGAKGLDKRLGLAQALESLGKGDELIVAKLDRLARDSYLSAYLQFQVEKRGARIVSASEETLNGDDATSKLLKTIIQAFSEFERQQIRSRIKSTMALKVSRNERVSRFARYGTTFTEDGKRVVVNTEEQKVIELVKTLKDGGMKITRIKKELELRGIKTAHGNDKWHYGQVYRLSRRVAQS